MTKNISYNKLFKLIVAFLIATLYSLIPSLILRDRSNYINYAVDTDIIVNNNLGKGFVYFLANEPLFLLINYLISLVIDPFLIPDIISFFISLVLIYFLMKEIKGFFFKSLAMVAVLFNHLFFHLQLVTLRQSLALSIFLIVTMYTKNLKKWILVSFILGFIHSSFFIVWGLLIVLFFVRKYKIKDQILFFIIFSLILSMSIFTIGSLIGVRQTESLESGTNQLSGLAFILYLSILILFLSRGDAYLKSYPYYPIAIMGLTVYLSLYFLLPMGGRLIATFLPFILCCMFNTTKYISLLFIIFYIIVNAIKFQSAIINNSLNEDFMYLIN